MSAVFRDRLETALVRLKPPLPVLWRRRIVPRDVPRFLRVVRFDQGQGFTITIPTARRTWWFWVSLAVVGLWLLLVPVAYFAAWQGPVVVNNRWVEGGFSVMQFVLSLLPLVAVTWAAWWWAFPRITVTADPETITVQGLTYDRATAQGFREGYALGGVERISKQGLYRGLRLQYGPWGDDLPFLVRYYYSAAYIVFLNDALEAVRRVDPADMAAVTGRRPAVF